ncbi:MAG: glutathione S-transferase family protein [Alphaproteobacteria bacterium]|nr:glutathione S-transferase family protein [Alphaproteobacteria bacterium]
MKETYRIFGAELSPYSIKVRSYFRYKNIPHNWIARTEDDTAEFNKFAKLPLVPLVVSAHGDAMQDSTPIIEAMEEIHPEPPIVPHEPVLAFISALIEEYADEWCNKHMFHYRWWYVPDQKSAGERLARGMRPGAADVEVQAMGEMIRERMIKRLSLVGSSPQTRDQIEASFKHLLEILEVHLATRPYLFGKRPLMADFGLASQIYEAWTDPTPHKIMAAQAPNVSAWAQRMLDPKLEGQMETWAKLAPTLTPLLHGEIAALFLPWSVANAAALARGDEKFTVELKGKPFTQETQKYHARSLAVLKERYAKAKQHTGLVDILTATGCHSYLV